jgi:putative membrane protein
MKRPAAARLLGMSDDEIIEVRAAVEAAEKRTTGEIAIAVTPESADYSFSELFASVIFGASVFAALVPFHTRITAFLDRIFWHLPPWYVPAFYGIVSFAAIALAFLFANIPALDRLVIPRRIRSVSVYRRALRHFVESGVYATRERSGILIFVSIMEREVRILADSGISAHISQDEWDRIASSLADGISSKKIGEAFVHAVEGCGTLLEKHFPPRADNPNELSDALVFLEAHE